MIIDMIYMGIIASDYKRYTKQLDKSGRIVGDKAYTLLSAEREAA